MFKRVGIVGEGKMGTGIFNYLADFNYELAWVCSRDADTGKLIRQFGRKIRRSLDAGIIDQHRFDRLNGTIISNDLSDLYSCDLVIEAVPEILDLKRKVFEELDRKVNPDAIFASNSSSINPSELAPEGRRSGQFAGIHFFYPVPLKNFVEVTISNETTPGTIEAVETFIEDIKRNCLLLDEKNSFILNRIFLEVQNEAFRIVHGGYCTFQQMDRLVKKHLFPYGIFDFCDSVGLDTMLFSAQNYTRDYPHKSYYSGFLSALEDHVLRGKLGMKTGEGFYPYPLDENPVDPPENEAEIAGHLHQTWLSAAKRFTALSHLPIDDANRAIREYFDIEKGPFE